MSPDMALPGSGDAFLRMGPRAHFLLLKFEMGVIADSLTRMLKPVIEGMGYECVGIEYISGARGSGVLRIYIDTPGGVTVDDCGVVSHQVSGVLDVEDPIRENFNLEVSSPGLDRPLFTPEHYERFCGNKVTLKFHGKWEGRRKLTGILRQYADGNVLLECDGEEIVVPYDAINSARLVPVF